MGSYEVSITSEWEKKSSETSRMWSRDGIEKRKKRRFRPMRRWDENLTEKRKRRYSEDGNVD